MTKEEAIQALQQKNESIKKTFDELEKEIIKSGTNEDIIKLLRHLGIIENTLKCTLTLVSGV